MNLGIVIGVEKYKSSSYNDLIACRNDAKLIYEVIKKVKDFKEILYINNSEPAHNVKNLISDFIEKYQSEDINEFFFYFSGHGERFSEDFLYLLSDYTTQKKETTSLRNSELDGWIKSISPKLTIKVIDACFSGTQYIKSDTENNLEFKKSAKKYGLNDLYFLFSSRDDEPSFAGNEYSKFTESILTSLTELDGDVRYRDIIAYVADDLKNQSSSVPVFVLQGTNTEKFGKIQKDIQDFILKEFGVLGEDLEHNIVNEDIEDKVELSLVDKLKEKEQLKCFSKEELESFFETFMEKIEVHLKGLDNYFNIEINNTLTSSDIPNKKRIGEWLDKKIKEENFFADIEYSIIQKEVQEYKALPKKPKRSRYSGLAAMAQLSLLGEDDTEYKLVTVKKENNYISGFNYNASLPNCILNINFNPKNELIEACSLFIVFNFSNKKIVAHYSYEILSKLNWNTNSQPECQDWRILDINLKDGGAADKYSKFVTDEISSWIIQYIEKILE